MKYPLNIVEAEERRLVRADGAGIHTFSNGSEHEGWACDNCYACRYWPREGPAGKYCAFEYAIFLHIASPELAELFGWTQNPEYATYRADYDKGDRCHGWHPPEHCPFLLRRDDDDDGDRPPPPRPDPLQLNLLADPTEDAAMLTNVPELVTT